MTYAADVYCGRDGRPLRHIYGLNNRRDSLDRAVRSLVNAVSRAVSCATSYRDLEECLQAARFQTREDAPTGLRNRHALDGNFLDPSGIGGAGERFLVFATLHGMESINDTRGHDAGDQLPDHVAQLLDSGSRGWERVYRLGGDEFVLLFRSELTGRNSPEHSDPERQARACFTGLVEQLNTEGFSGVSVSVWIAAASESPGNLVEALPLADQPMYENMARKVHGPDGDQE